MNLAPALLRRLERTLIDMATFADSEDDVLQSIARDARDLVARLPRKAPKKALAEPLRKDAKAKRAATHRQSTKEIREARMAIDGGKCTSCGFSGSPWNPLHLHHDKGGSGRRRQRQSVSNTRMLCLACHRHHHAGKR